MRDNIKRSIQRISEKAYDFAAGDYVVWVAPDGKETGLLTLRRTRERGEGLTIDIAGVKESSEEDLFFLRCYVVSQGVEAFEPLGHFRILGERWDLAEKHPIAMKVGPAGGLHDAVKVVIRKAVELNSTVPGSEFGFRCLT
jgi:hypothetical protein